MNQTVEKRELYAHCHNAICPGYRQEPVKGIREETLWTYKDNGGDINGVERSMVAFKFANEDERACKHCKQPRELSEIARPSYQPLSGYDPLGLINGSVDAFNAQKVNTDADAKIAELEAKLNLLMSALEEPEK